MFTHHILCLVFSFLELWIHVRADGSLTQCLTSSTNHLRIRCPTRHVIYNPSIVAGVSTSGRCAWSAGDCVGTPDVVSKQVYRCHWKRECDVTVNNNDVISCGMEPNNTAKRIKYLIIKQVYCIPKGIIVDVCSRRHISPHQRHGVIRSHRKYPVPIRFKRRACTSRIPIRKSDKLFFKFIENVDNDKDITNVTSLWKWNNGRRHKITMATDKHDAVNIDGRHTAAVDILAEFDDSPESKHGGFIMPFALFNRESLENILQWPSDSRSLIREIGWIFEGLINSSLKLYVDVTATDQLHGATSGLVRNKNFHHGVIENSVSHNPTVFVVWMVGVCSVKAVIELCMVDTSGEVTLSCDADDVIYSPQFAVAGIPRRPPTCEHGRYPCGGYTAHALVQKNSCYWNNRCAVTWRDSAPILASIQPSCIGHVASIIGFAGHRCISRANIHDGCTDGREHINSDWGVIRSHSSYPWYFDSDVSNCKRIIKVGRNKKLTVIVQDIDLDPDGGDVFYITHIRDGSRRVMMNASISRSNTHVTAHGGRVNIRLRTFNETQTGRGYVLFFKRERYKHNVDTGNDPVPNIPGNRPMGNVASDQGIGQTRNRGRLCGRRKWNRGQRCWARLWTDYFTRLD